MPLAKDTALLAAVFAVSGALHLARPGVYEPLVPAWLPAHREIILGSGVAELACAGGLAIPATRRPAGWASTALLVGVFPGNLKMADDARRSRSPLFRAVSYTRLPMQIPMIRAALRAARR